MSLPFLLRAAVVGAGSLYLARRAMTSQETFAGKVAVVTGGSRGLGLEIARLLAYEGAHLALCARDESELETAEQMLEARGADVYTLRCDVTERDQVDRFVAAVLERYGRIDLLVNCAGIIEIGPVECMTDEEYDAAIRTHFHGPRYFCEAVLPGMRERRRGRIVNIASIGGRVNLPHGLPYSASKFALVGYSEGLGIEVAKDGISVTTVCPGTLRTGSPLNATFKGQAEKEYAWFAISDTLPGLSVDSAVAAQRILDAARQGRRELIFPLPAKLAATAHDLFRETSLGVLSLIARAMPKPAGTAANPGKIGWQAESDATPEAARASIHKSAQRNNE